MSKQQTGIDRYYLFVVISIVAIGIIALGGYIFLLSTSAKPAPELLNICFACAGALFGGVIKPTQDNTDKMSDLVAELGTRAALDMVKETFREGGKL